MGCSCLAAGARAGPGCPDSRLILCCPSEGTGQAVSPVPDSASTVGWSGSLDLTRQALSDPHDVGRGSVPGSPDTGRLAQAWAGSGLGDTLSLGQSDGREDAEATGPSPAGCGAGEAGRVRGQCLTMGESPGQGSLATRQSKQRGRAAPFGWSWDRITRPGHSPGQSRRGSLRGQRGRADPQGRARARGN